jgi:hypothetical protein
MLHIPPPPFPLTRPVPSTATCTERSRSMAGLNREEER